MQIGKIALTDQQGTNNDFCIIFRFFSMPNDCSVICQLVYDDYANRTFRVTTSINGLLGHLFSCFYCMSHWMVAAGMLIYHPTLLHSGISLFDWVMTAFIVLTITTFINGLLFKVFQAAIRTHVMKHEAQQILNPHK